MKKLQSYLLTLLALIAMAACSDQTDNGTAGPDSDRLMQPQFRNRYTVNAGSNDPYICGVQGLNTIQLYWSRVGEDCIGYEIKVATQKLNTAEDWADETKVETHRIEGADTDNLLLKDLAYSTDYYFAIRALSARGEAHHSLWYGYGDTGHWADYMSIRTNDRYNVPNIIYQKGNATKTGFDIFLDRSYLGFNHDNNNVVAGVYNNKYTPELIEEFSQHFATETDAFGNQVWRVTHIMVYASSSNPTANVPEELKMYKIPDDVWQEDGTATVHIEGLDQNAVYVCEALDENLLADKPIVDAKFNGIMQRMKGDPGEPILLAANPQDTIHFEISGTQYAEQLPVPATSIQETLVSFMTDLTLAEGQTFYLEGGQTYFLRGGMNVYKGFRLATNPEDLAAGKGRAKVYTYHGFDFTGAGGNSYASFMLGRTAQGSENPLIALDMETFIVEDIDFGAPLAKNVGDPAATNSYFMNTYGNSMGVSMQEMRFTNCSFQDCIGGFFRVQGSYGYEIENFTVENCDFYNGGYYSTSGRRYNYFHTHPDKSVRQNIFKNFVFRECTVFDNSLGRFFSHNNNPKEDWPADFQYNITVENNTFVNFGRSNGCHFFYMREYPGGSTFTVKNNLFVKACKPEDTARPIFFVGCDMRTMRGGSGEKVTLNIGNNWSTNEAAEGCPDDQIWNPANSAFSSTNNAFGKLTDEEVIWGEYGREGLVVKAADIKATQLMVQPNPPFVQTAGVPHHNDHRCDGIDGTVTATNNIGVGMVDLHFKDFSNAIYLNNVGASKWRQQR